MNKKWNYSTWNWEAYSSFEGMSSSHWIVTANIRLSLRKKAARTITTVYYDWSLHNKRDIRDKYILTLRNTFDALSGEIRNIYLNDENENFVNAHEEAAAEYIPTKQRAKTRVPWGTLRLEKSMQAWKLLPKPIRRNPTNINALKLKKAQNEFANIYPKEQTEYMQHQINKIRYSVEDRKSRIAWQTATEVSRRESPAKAELKATNQEERIHLWKQYFENLLGKPPKVTYEPITGIISKQLDIKLGQFTRVLNSVLKRIKCGRPGN